MKNDFLFVFMIFVAVCNFAYADIEVKSQNGNSIIFSQPKYGNNIDPDAWSKLIFSQGGKKIDLSRAERYYTEDGSSKVSPSGSYLVVNSVAGDVLDFGNGTKQYASKAYCSVIDMRNGCIVSDWDGEVCSYQWTKGKDILASSDDSDADTFDFLTMKPSVKRIKNSYSTLKVMDASNLMRCDKVSNENVDDYQTLLKENEEVRPVVQRSILNYINKLEISSSISVSKSYLYSSPDESSITKTYLVTGDKVKIIQLSPDKKWMEIGYISHRGNPLVKWVKSDNIK
ncbi:hypothetical protein [Shimwellia blattae]|uniref:SH3 domain-containing protein n=1 Tax=Shimwellia blattae (strain ATCC 29907 / DSM 4481 / JCM 1650 / NBRC 105725 / CDC 9005-74) TaxID=630626 RepID=I2B6W4_SHIBC|nr:hypothetical protein [Shimwellia blattae]AFJ46268.1 hypothetical protein EBL_c11640 [Shimwellia blattae DSM 4481 = NBRC 105725]GAB83218.1 hypothetical protein EB105725_54_00020 [Shimwellia blattae DSM 4481 = NBRC 105725]VDY63732.1 Uncharacterised protein [Shimwellia blattae]VEC21876.1 Uncharacterised protein [Shimwellia blattae]